MSNIYPFTALVGQDQMKLALLLNAVDPRVGGVLIQGDKGTAKSTAVRGLSMKYIAYKNIFANFIFYILCVPS